MSDFQKKTIIVTGGARSIGLHYVRAFAERGANVTMFDIENGEEQAGEINRQIGRPCCSYERVDVGDEASIRRGVLNVIGRGHAPDVLVNNAALFAKLEHKSFLEIDVETWDRVMQVNVRGAFLMAKHVAPHMIARGSGKIINISSATAFKGLDRFSHYVTSKAALLGLTKTLAIELGRHGINVNTLAPGLIRSDSAASNDELFGQNFERVLASRSLKRDAFAKDVVGALLFLASHDSDFVSGQTLVVDGGSVTL